MPLWDDVWIWLLEWVGPLFAFLAALAFTIAAIATSASNWVSA